MYEHITPETLRADMLENIDYWSKNEGTMVSTLLAAPAYAIWQWYTNLEAVQYMIFPDENSGIWIDKQANQYGITRKPGEPARCVMTLTGSSGMTVPAGKVFQTPGGIQFTTDADCVLAGGTGTVTATAVEAGTAGNVRENELTVQKSVTRGLTSWTHTAAAGGVDEETDESLLERYYDRLRKPATSGNVYHYEQWAREVPGVGAVRVIPLWDGPGTVKVVIAGDGYTVPDSEVVTAAADHIEEQHPIGADVTVEAAEAKEIDLYANILADGDADIVKANAEEAARRYLAGLREQWRTGEVVVRYSEMMAALVEADGVIDVGNLLINGGTSNITSDDVPVEGTFLIFPSEI